MKSSPAGRRDRRIGPASWERAPGQRAEAGPAGLSTGTPEAALPGLLAAREELRRLPDNPWKEQKLAELDAVVLACAGLVRRRRRGSRQHLARSDLTLTSTVLLRRPAQVTSRRGVSIADAGRAARRSSGRGPGRVEDEGGGPGDARICNPAWLDAARGGAVPGSQSGVGWRFPRSRRPLQAEVSFRFGSRVDHRAPAGRLQVDRPGAGRALPPPRGAACGDGGQPPPGSFFSSQTRPRGHSTSPSGACAGLRGRWASICLQDSPPRRPDAPFSVAAGGETRCPFTVTPPGAGRPGHAARGRDGEGQRFDRGLRRIDASHIPIQTWLPPSTVQLTRADVAHASHASATSPVQATRCPQALRQAGYEVTPLSVSDLRDGALSRFDAIVFGIRAFNVEPQLEGLHGKLMSYVSPGGTVLVQYVTTNLADLHAAGDRPIPLHHRPRSRHRRDRRGRGLDGPGAHRAEPYRPRRLGGLGAGAGAVLRRVVGPALRHPAGDARPRRGAADGARSWSRGPGRGPSSTPGCPSSGSSPPASRARSGSSPTWWTRAAEPSPGEVPPRGALGASLRAPPRRARAGNRRALGAASGSSGEPRSTGRCSS